MEKGKLSYFCCNLLHINFEMIQSASVDVDRLAMKMLKENNSKLT